VILEGRLTRDPELKELPNCTIAKFSVANNRKKNGEEVADFFDVVAFDRQAELAAQFLTKGAKVIVEGALRQNRWQNAEGQNRSKVEILGRMIHFLTLPAKDGPTPLAQDVNPPKVEPREKGTDEEPPF